jgi:hypothetical protein
MDSRKGQSSEGLQAYHGAQQLTNEHKLLVSTILLPRAY